MDFEPENHDESTDSSVLPELSPIEERQIMLAHHVKLISRKMSHALFVFGSQGGLGKTRTILKTFDEEGVSPVLINSHITPLALFSKMYAHRTEEVLFFDDCDSMYSSMIHLGLLRSALWGSPRIVTYGSTQLPEGLPDSFETTARFVFAANVIPKKNDAFKAVLSRCDVFDLWASNADVLTMYYRLAKDGYNGISPIQAEEVIEFIAQNSDDRQLSLRLLGPSMRKFAYARDEGIDWRPLVLSQLQTLGRKQDATKRLDNKLNDVRLLEQILRKFPDSVSDQQIEWSKATSKSRASFYRTLARYRDQQES